MKKKYLYWLRNKETQNCFGGWNSKSVAKRELVKMAELLELRTSELEVVEFEAVECPKRHRLAEKWAVDDMGHCLWCEEHIEPILSH